MRLNEITFSDRILPINSDELLNHYSAIIFDTIDGSDIYVARDQKYTYFYILSDKDRNKLAAYVVSENQDISGFNPLVRIENIAKRKGLITTIIVSILSKGFRLIVTQKEPLTSDGLFWIEKLIQNGNRGISIKDENGNTPNIEELEKEWNENKIAVRTGEEEKGNIALYIENRSINRKKLDEDLEQWRDNDLLLKPFLRYYSDDLW